MRLNSLVGGSISHNSSGVFSDEFQHVYKKIRVMNINIFSTARFQSSKVFSELKILMTRNYHFEYINEIRKRHINCDASFTLLRNVYSHFTISHKHDSKFLFVSNQLN